MGRRHLLNPDRFSRIVEAVETGAMYEDAAAYAGVTPTTLYNWLARGRNEQRRLEHHPDEDPTPDPGERVFLELLEAVEQKNGELAVYAVGHWKLAIPGNPKAAQAFLRARMPHWRADTEGEGVEDQAASLTAAQGAAIAAAVNAALDAAKLSPAERRKAIAAAALALKAGDPVDVTAREAS